MGRRSALLITGLVVAALGTFLVFLYTNNVRSTVSAEGEPVDVYVAGSSISVGTVGSAVTGSLQQQTLPASAVPANAITDPAVIAEQFALVPVAAGQVVLGTMFGNPSNVESMSIPEGKMAVAVQLDDAQRVAGFVTPGSEVAVFATVEREGVTETNLMLPRATVAAVGPATVISRTTGQGEDANTEEIPTAILTLALDQGDVAKVIYGQQNAQLHFALLTPQSKTGPAAGVTDTSLFAR